MFSLSSSTANKQMNTKRLSMLSIAFLLNNLTTNKPQSKIVYGFAAKDFDRAFWAFEQFGFFVLILIIQ